MCGGGLDKHVSSVGALPWVVYSVMRGMSLSNLDTTPSYWRWDDHLRLCMGRRGENVVCAIVTAVCRAEAVVLLWQAVDTDVATHTAAPSSAAI